MNCGGTKRDCKKSPRQTKSAERKTTRTSKLRRQKMPRIPQTQSGPRSKRARWPFRRRAFEISTVGLSDVSTAIMSWVQNEMYTQATAAAVEPVERRRAADEKRWRKCSRKHEPKHEKMMKCSFGESCVIFLSAAHLAGRLCGAVGPVMPACFD